MAHYAKIACDTLTMLLKSRTHITELFDWALCWLCIEQKKVCSVIIGYYKLFVGSLLSTFSDPSLSCERDDLMRFSSVWIVQFKVPWMWFRVKKERIRLRFVKEVERGRGSKQNKRKKRLALISWQPPQCFSTFLNMPCLKCVTPTSRYFLIIICLEIVQSVDTGLILNS